MASREISLDIPRAERAYALTGPGRLVLIPIIVGLLTLASILLLIHQENRAIQYTIEATEVWSGFQLKTVKAAIEEDPNLKAQYTEEQEVLRQDAQELREKSRSSRHAFMICAYASLLFLLGTGTAMFALVAKSTYASHAGLLLGIIGVVLVIRALL